MYINRDLRDWVDRMFVPPLDYDQIQVQTRETSDEPVLIITLYRNNKVVFFQNYEMESSFLGLVEVPGYAG